MAISFGSSDGEWGALSNFAPYGVEFGGEYWATVEHYYQYRRCGDRKQAERIRRAPTAREANAIGSGGRAPSCPHWDSMKVDVMRRALRRKFELHEVPRRLLLSTRDEKLVACDPEDYFWCGGANGTGRNMLGVLLMEIRDELAPTRSGGM